MNMRVSHLLCCLVLFAGSGLAEETAKPVSFYHDLVPIFKRSCTGCHHPGKLKADLDITTYSALRKGGKHGPAFVPGRPQESRLLEEVGGEEPAMPKEGDPLSQLEVSLIERWIAQGAKDDSPSLADAFKLAEPPVYRVAPVVSALAFSPDGELLALSGYHEVLLHKGDGSQPIARLLGESPRIESIAFTADGKYLAACGGAPARFGEVQVWDTASKSLVKACKVSNDSLYGVSFSPDGQRVAFGCADKTVRVIRWRDGQEILKFDNHSDWVLGTIFTLDGKRLLSGSRDRALKLIDASSGQFIDDVNKLLEGVLCLARHPKRDEALYGGDLGGVRIYRISENQGRTAANNDVNLVREFERQSGPARAVCFNPDGTLIAVGGAMPEVRVYKTSDGSQAATLTGHTGAIFCVAFHPRNGQLATGGYDGTVRLYDPVSGKLLKSFVPVTIGAGT